MVKHWIEAIRPRTIPVSLSGVLAGTVCAIVNDSFSLVPALLCLLFAALAQIASNFANEYFDYKNGIDHQGRAGFRRAVTEGDITPSAMKYATYGTLMCAAIVGCILLLYGEWWMIFVGIVVVLAALGYSAGPFPLSHNGLGDIAVIIFFGIVPVTLTCYLQQSCLESFYISMPTSVAIGLLAANVLVVNNYRDMEDDEDADKMTTVVIFGRKRMGRYYLISGFIAMAFMIPLLEEMPAIAISAPVLYLAMHTITWRKVIRSSGAELNPLLGATARNLLVFTLLLLAFAIIGSVSC